MSTADDVKDRVDIVDLVSRYVPLQRAGRNFKACCPFHDERTPSFVVFPDNNSWHCFGACGTGGDAFSFLMKRENLDFREALETLATEVGVVLDAGPNRPDDGLRERIYAANSQAALFFQETLFNHPGAEAARAYLQRRGIDRETTQNFQLGFALESWESLLTYLGQKGFEPPFLHHAGLVKHNEARNSYYDAFRGRVIIPIRDRQGRIIGFGGRVLDDVQPKYLNTSDTPLFHKSRIIYGLDLAYQAIRQNDKVVIVEGYMDVIAAHQHGYANVVACMGTAVTEEQLQQLQRYTNNFVLALDADAAGQQATLRGLNQARQALGRVQKPSVGAGGRIHLEERLAANLLIASIPQGKDPDDLIRADSQAWPALVDNALTLVDFYFNLVKEQYDLTSAQGKGLAVAELAPLIAELNDTIEQQHYIQQLSRLVQIDEQTITGRISAAAQTRRLPRAGSQHASSRPWSPGATASSQKNLAPQPLRGRTGRRSAPTLAAVPQHEDYLMALLLEEPELLIRLAGFSEKNNIPPMASGDWQNSENQAIFRTLKQFIVSDEPWDLEMFQENLTSHLHPRLGRLLAYGAGFPVQVLTDKEEAAIKTLMRMRLERLKSDLTVITHIFHDAQAEGDQTAVVDYSATINHNRRERNHLEQIFMKLSKSPYFTR